MENFTLDQLKQICFADHSGEEFERLHKSDWTDEDDGQFQCCICVFKRNSDETVYGFVVSRYGSHHTDYEYQIDISSLKKYEKKVKTVEMWEPE